MGNKSYMTQREKNALLEFIAATGENYERYVKWCGEHGIEQVFTKKYLHTWVQRRRPKLRVVRTQRDEDIRRLSMYDRERRIRELENDLDTINQMIEKNFDMPEMVVKLLEQKRKTSQAVSQERGEWNKIETKESDGTAARERLRSGVMELLKGTETQIIDGKVIVAKDQRVLQ